MSAAADHTFSVAEFGQLLRETLTVTFPRDVWVRGEVRNMTRPPSGHVYFDLVDAAEEPGRAPDAVLSVVLMRSTRQVVNRQIKAAGGGIRIDDGVKLRVRGAPDFYLPQGRMQLRMNGIDPAYTLGELGLARAQLLKRLADEGLLARNQGLDLPLAPLRIGLVTARHSAAAADFRDELLRSGIAFDIVLAATTVQGDAAPHRIARAIASCERREVDVVAVVRGGGARTDLVAFDHEVVARAIAACSVPVLTGVGHEVDDSVADAVAHLALKTPTACAAHIVERVLAAELDADRCWGAIVDTARARLAAHETQLRHQATLAGHRATAALSDADRATADAARQARHTVNRQLDRQSDRVRRAHTTLGLVATHRLDTADQHLIASLRRLEPRSRQHLVAADRHLDALEERRRLLDPARNLARGWSITTDPDGSVVRTLDALQPGVRLTTRVAGGSIRSTVDSVLPEDD